ncbi:MAG: indole-3-glycerol phosphate synthase TrpC [Anaerolineae bacterium]|nr:indole-3-glycerol phosphate synthase TrpC [Anaerolineae bacterium]
MTILDDIIKYKRIEELPKQMQAREAALVRAEAALAPKPKDFVAALRAAGRVALIAEVKKASPSKGLLRHNFDPIELAQTYAANGASAISVLTDAKYFQGKLDYLTQIRKHLDRLTSSLPTPYSLLPPPLLRKDFIFHPYQVYEARAAGADALLLITAVLKDKEMADLLALTHELGMSALIEVHDRAELERVLPLQPRLIGVNNRDLRDFSVNLNTCIQLRQYVPAGTCFVAESGIHTAADVARLAKEGIDALLVGEALVKAKDVGKKVRELVNYEL